MNDNAALNLIRNTFENSFDRERFLIFAKNLLNKFDESKAFHAHGYVKDKFKKATHIVKTYERLGTYTDPRDNKIDILVVYLERDEPLDRARTTLSSFVGDYLKQRDSKDAALVAFVPLNRKNWRFSIVRMNYRIEKDNTGKIKAKQELTPARRFSFLVGENEPSHTAQSRLIPIIENDRDNPTLDQLEEAFSVEPVTNEFFQGYRKVFFKLEQNFQNQVHDSGKAHNFAHLLLNRIMFLYFIAKKRWIGDNDKFLKTFWTVYSASGRKNTFYNDWLSVLFFEAFNNKFTPKKYFPSEINTSLLSAPYLNGGLFSRHELDELAIKISDDDLLIVFNFFDRYNFTIREDLPLEKEVAVDPEMIGKVYESLVNLSELSDERGDAGIFYTPRVEIDFMCRRALVEYFNKHLAPTPSKDDIYLLLFPKNDRDRDRAIENLRIAAVWPNLVEEKLDSLSIIDPAVGSGSFLVGMLQILTSLYKLVYKDSGRNVDDFEIKKQIIGRSLYGVDVMEWAVHVCELRLWLQLIVEADIPFEERKTSPLLPNLSFKIRPGDSLVQEIGDINLSELGRTALNPVVKRKITALKQAKYDYFYNNRSSKFYRSEELLKQEEQLIFQMIIDERVLQLKKEMMALENNGKQQNLQLPGMEKEDDQKNLIEEADKRSIGEKQEEIELLRALRQDLKQRKPFIWDIDFVEIFSDPDEAGFDLVIGNPPYVRQEKIADPTLSKEKITTKNKREYKDKLTESVKNKYPWIKKLDKKSDLYIYFYFHGFSLLNNLGTLCYITSNSWLDVGYGKNLQEFLLSHTPVYAVFDNQAKRSFESADVNTIILLAGAPTGKENDYSGERVKFVMFKKPFEEVINIKNLLIVENSLKVISNPDLRVFPATQYELLRDGWEYSSDTRQQQIDNSDMSVGGYGGNKWGAKFLRAPDIYFTCLDRQKVKGEISLGSLFNGERYLNTGGADGFFILTKAMRKNGKYFEITNTSKEGKKFNEPSFLIREKYLKPLIKDITKQNKTIEVNEADAWVLCIDEDEVDKETRKYISWGEKAGFNKRSVTKNQNPWFKPTRQMKRSGKILFPRSFSNSHLIYYNPKELIALRFYRLYAKNKLDLISLIALFNSSYFGMLLELNGPANLGLGALDVTMESFLKIKIPTVFNNDLSILFNEIKSRPIDSIFSELSINPNKEIRSQEPNPRIDRKRLDDYVFDFLNLSTNERNEVYWSLCELVKNRLEKAKSV